VKAITGKPIKHRQRHEEFERIRIGAWGVTGLPAGRCLKPAAKNGRRHARNFYRLHEQNGVGPLQTLAAAEPPTQRLADIYSCRGKDVLLFAATDLLLHALLGGRSDA
jgi:hypothetical protein